MPITDSTEVINKDQIRQFDNVVGIQNQSSRMILYTMGSDFAANKEGIYLHPSDSHAFPQTTIFVKNVVKSAPDTSRVMIQVSQ